MKAEDPLEVSKRLVKVVNDPEKQKLMDDAYELVTDLIDTRLSDLGARPDEERDEGTEHEEQLLEVALNILSQKSITVIL